MPELDLLLPARAAGAQQPRRATAVPAVLAAEALEADRVAARALRRPRSPAYLDRTARTAPRGVRERLDAELATIAALGFAGYFLTVAEVVDLIRGMGVRVAARGSGAGSLVNHLLGISGVDPLAHGLLMERFLSPLRRALPDIDVDVESARRTEVYDRILERFGGERCACVSMRDTYRVRHAVRDVGAALGMPPGEIDAFAKAFPHIRARDARAGAARAARAALLRASAAWPRAASSTASSPSSRRSTACRATSRCTRAACCSPTPRCSTAPRSRPAAMGFPMSQFDKDDVEELGLLKLDVLGIRMQSAMAYALDRDRRGSTAMVVDLDAVPLDDEPTYELIRSTHTLGCFQIESPGQRELVGKFAPETFDDLIIDISLFRPGPVKSDMVTPFLRARQGWNAAGLPARRPARRRSRRPTASWSSTSRCCASSR